MSTVFRRQLFRKQKFAHLYYLKYIFKCILTHNSTKFICTVYWVPGHCYNFSHRTVNKGIPSYHNNTVKNIGQNLQSSFFSAEANMRQQQSKIWSYPLTQSEKKNLRAFYVLWLWIKSGKEDKDEMLPFLVVSLFDIHPVRFTLKDVNKACSQFPGEIKATVSTDIARDLPLNCWRHYGRCRCFCFPQWSRTQAWHVPAWF